MFGYIHSLHAPLETVVQCNIVQNDEPLLKVFGYGIEQCTSVDNFNSVPFLGTYLVKFFNTNEPPNCIA